MREIKFRAWLRPPFGEDENGYEMVYDLAFEEYEPLNDQLKRVKTLMQYTGLLDKQGVDIYEGDLMNEWNQLTHRYDAVGIVTFGEFLAEIYDVHGWFLADKDGRQLSEGGLHYNRFEVIGNIYENPELLESK